MRELNNVVFIGAGGIGTAAIPPVLRFLSFSYKSDEPVSVMIVDGDECEAKNLERQDFRYEDIEVNKADALVKRMTQEFNALDIESFPRYVDPENMHEVIKNGDVVMLMVDNYKTRKQVSDFCQGLNNIIVVSGGNDWTDGNIQVYIRENGVDVTAPLTTYHPEIENPADKSPADKGCAELMESFPQLLAMNMNIASLMFNAFYRIVSSDDLSDMYGEAYTDILTNTVRPATRKPISFGA